MVSRVSAIVEGEGEVKALPVLLRRINDWLSPCEYPEIVTPIRVHRDRFLNKDEEFRRHLLLAAATSGEDGWILVLLDADDDCPAELGPKVLERARGCVPHRPVSVVLANREYEAWFIASAQSLDGYRGFAISSLLPGDPELPRNAKGWMGRHMVGGTYRETTDQPAFSSRICLQTVFARSRSFRKLCSEWKKHVLQKDSSP